MSSFASGLISRIAAVSITLFGMAVSIHAEGTDAKWQHRREHESDRYHGINDDPGRPRKPRRTMAGDRDWGECPPDRYLECDRVRTGGHDQVAIYAKPGVTKKYAAGFVGGGAWHKRYFKFDKPIVQPSRSRKSNGGGHAGEGTWGMDYEGLFGRANIWLCYTPDRFQGGEGAYETDGEPKVVAKTKEFKSKLIDTLLHREHE